MKYKLLAKNLTAKYAEIQISFDKKLSDLTTFKIGGTARLFVTADTTVQLMDTLKLCRLYKLKYFILGKGSNILASDKILNYVFISLGKEFKQIRLHNGILTVGAGVSLYKLNAFCIEYSLSGLEFSFGIPGSVGGGIVMNAGAYGGQMSDVVASVYYTDGERLFVKTKNMAQFDYRSSCFIKGNFVILKAVLNLKAGEKEQIEKRCKENMQKRISSQPYSAFSAGSVFKKPATEYTPVLIEKCGLKGKTIGGAQISTVHCGFIVNNGKATANDVLKLIIQIEKTVFKKFGIMLEREIKVIK